MLIIEDNSVYEIDEECIQKNEVPKECQTFEKIKKEKFQKWDAKKEDAKKER